jgi:glutathione S-transferase
MKLFYSPTSPFVRKVVASAIALELEGQIDLVPTNAHASPAALLAANPLSKVPCLVTDDGVALYDSPVICEYLDAQSEALPLIPKPGSLRWRVLKQQALADGIMDAAVERRAEEGRDDESGRHAKIHRLRMAVERSLDWLEGNVPSQRLDLGSIAIACALGYLDFRYKHEPWRQGRPTLAAWFQVFGEHKAIADTAPKEPK